MVAGRSLIVNADDFGRSPGINRGIIRAHEQGIVTSASLMVRWPAATAAAAYALKHPALSVGLHVDLAEWTCRKNEWVPAYEVVPVQDGDAVARELARQLADFERLMGRTPTHLDSHQHIHREEPALTAFRAAGKKLNVPLRYASRARYCGEFYGQCGKGSPFPEGISVDNLLRILRDLPAGMSELGCHPGEGDDVEATYLQERATEVETLCDPRVRECLTSQGITLRSFHGLPAW